MQEHHKQSLGNLTHFFAQESEVIALILGGSLAHGFASSNSDIDVMIIVPDEEYQRRLASGSVHFMNSELCTYPGGYIDGKYLGRGFLSQVHANGSEPARFAFQDAVLLLSRDGDLADLIKRIAQYPHEHKTERIRRFYAQFEAWYWYTQEAIKHQNSYLLGLSVSKLVLFGGRLPLAHNEQLYPYHKWFLRVLDKAPNKPEGIVEQMECLCDRPEQEAIKAFYDAIKGFREWETPQGGWPAQFMVDSEWNWQMGLTPVDDL